MSSIIPNNVKKTSNGGIWIGKSCVIIMKILPVLNPEKRPNAIPTPGINIKMEIRKLLVNMPILSIFLILFSNCSFKSSDVDFSKLTDVPIVKKIKNTKIPNIR